MNYFFEVDPSVCASGNASYVWIMKALFICDGIKQNLVTCNVCQYDGVIEITVWG